MRGKEEEQLGSLAMTTVKHPNCPQTVQICLVWFCCCCALEKRNANGTQKRSMAARRRVATQCNDERKIDMHVISRIRTSTRLADVDDAVSCTHTHAHTAPYPPNTLPSYIYQLCRLCANLRSLFRCLSLSLSC